MRKRENAAKHYEPGGGDNAVSFSIFEGGLSPVFKWLFLATAKQLKTFCLITDI